MYILQVVCIYMYMYTDLESHVHNKYCHMNDSIKTLAIYNYMYWYKNEILS